MPKHYDYCVLGAGLAGLHTALELLEKDASVCILDPQGVAGGASGTPVGLANPATGRFASRSWNAEESLNSLLLRLKVAQDYGKQPFYKQSGILRPALDRKIATKMQNNMESDHWEPGSIKWMNEEDLKHFHPGINCFEGGVWIPKGITIHIPEYLNALKYLIETKSGYFYLNENYELTKKGNWLVSLKNELDFTASNLVFTSGIWTTHSEYWSHLKLHAVKGQTLIGKTKEPILFDHAVSALGYFSKVDKHTLILGSTYEHNFKHKEPDDFGKEYILDRLGRVLPKLVNKIDLVSSWAGIRASSPDRKPYIGAHPTIENCFVFAGLGSKGLLYSSIGARILVEYIFEGSQIPLELNLNRFA